MAPDSRSLAAALALGSIVSVLAVAAHAQRAPRPSAPEGMRAIPGGTYEPFYPAEPGERLTVEAFALNEAPVTNAQFLEFVTARPRWQRDRVARLFADEGYLSHWSGAMELGAGAQEDAPVTRVSWFAAKTYCQWRGARLPSEAEWEWAARADEARSDGMTREGGVARILEWYAGAQRGAPGPVRRRAPDVHGVYDLHGLHWEWVSDFGASMVSSDNRQEGDRESERFCGGASSGSTDTRNYAAFMRFAFRSSLQASYTVRNLGFRCAADLPVAEGG